MDDDKPIQIAVRLPTKLHERILRFQAKAEKTAPGLSKAQAMRMLLGEALLAHRIR